jgi:hypothetical protein
VPSAIPSLARTLGPAPAITTRTWPKRL